MYRRCKLINIVDCYKNITIRANTIYNFHVRAFRAQLRMFIYVYTFITRALFIRINRSQNRGRSSFTVPISYRTDRELNQSGSSREQGYQWLSVTTSARLISLIHPSYFIQFIIRTKFKIEFLTIHRYYTKLVHLSDQIITEIPISIN